jgi:hypothetical protein
VEFRLGWHEQDVGAKVTPDSSYLANVVNHLNQKVATVGFKRLVKFLGKNFLLWSLSLQIGKFFFKILIFSDKWISMALFLRRFLWNMEVSLRIATHPTMWTF